jgi:hypothetical protein
MCATHLVRQEGRQSGVDDAAAPHEDHRQIAGPWSPPGMPLESAGTQPSPMIGTNSTLQCQFLGVIKIIHPGG